MLILFNLSAEFSFVVLLWILPYAVIFLLHMNRSILGSWAARWQRAMSPKTQHTTFWLCRNLGAFLHLYRLMISYAVSMGLFGHLPIIDQTRRNAQRATFIIFQLFFAVAESYDLRLLIIIVPLFGVPIWAKAFAYAGSTNGLQDAVCNAVIMISVCSGWAVIKSRQWKEQYQGLKDGSKKAAGTEVGCQSAWSARKKNGTNMHKEE